MVAAPGVGRRRGMGRGRRVFRGLPVPRMAELHPHPQGRPGDALGSGARRRVRADDARRLSRRADPVRRNGDRRSPGRSERRRVAGHRRHRRDHRAELCLGRGAGAAATADQPRAVPASRRADPPRGRACRRRDRHRAAERVPARGRPTRHARRRAGVPAAADRRHDRHRGGDAADAAVRGAVQVRRRPAAVVRPAGRALSPGDRRHALDRHRQRRRLWIPAVLPAVRAGGDRSRPARTGWRLLQPRRHPIRPDRASCTCRDSMPRNSPNSRR